MLLQLSKYPTWWSWGAYNKSKGKKPKQNKNKKKKKNKKEEMVSYPRKKTKQFQTELISTRSEQSKGKKIPQISKLTSI